MLAAAYGYAVVLNNFAGTALLVRTPASSFVVCACSPVGPCFVCTPSFLLLWLCNNHPAHALQPAYSLHLWQSGGLMYGVCARVCVSVCVCVCVAFLQPYSDASAFCSLCNMLCRLQLHCSGSRRNTGLQMSHQVCTMLLSTISVAGTPVCLCG